MALTIEVFRAGTHTAMSGVTANFTEADLDQIVSSYDPALSEAPVVVGHPTSNGPAFGWVKSLQRKGSTLLATIDQLNTNFVEAVRSGAYKKVSASFYPPTSPSNPKPGAHYFRHLGFLGAMPPAVKGLAPFSFAGTDEDAVCFDFGELDNAMLFRSLRDWILAKFGQADADAALPPDAVNNSQITGVLDAVTTAQGDSMNKSFAEPNTAQQPPTAAHAPGQPAAGAAQPKPPPTFAALWAVMATLLPGTDADKEAAKAKLEAAFNGQADAPATAAAPGPMTADHAEREAKLRKRERDAKTRDHVSFVEGLVKGGKPLPETREALLGVMAVLDGEPVNELSFGEGEKRSPLEIFQAALGRMKPEIDYSERSEDRGDGDGASDRAQELANEALAFQEAESKKGITVTTAEAVRAVEKGKAKK